MTEEEYLDQLRLRVNEASEVAQELTGGLTTEQRLWTSDPKKWSVAECFEHLILTDRLWYPKIEEALQEAPSDADRTGQAFRPTLFGRCFLGLMGERVKIPVKSNPMFRPGDDVPADAPERFLEEQEELLLLIGRARRTDLRDAVVAFPFTNLLKLCLGETLKMLVDHQHRHLRQIERIMQTDGFPSAGAAATKGRQESPVVN